MIHLQTPKVVTGDFALDAVSAVPWPKPASGRRLRVDLETGGIVLTGTRVKFPDGTEWRFRSRWMSYQLADGEGSQRAAAQRRRSRVFDIASPAGDYQLQAKRREIPGWRRTREARLVDTAGTEVAFIRLSYTKECDDDSDTARKHWSGSFEGSLEVGDSVAVPALLLALRLTAGIWSRRLPKTGEWTSFPLTKSLGSSETLFYPHWRRTR